MQHRTSMANKSLVDGLDWMSGTADASKCCKEDYRMDGAAERRPTERRKTEHRRLNVEQWERRKTERRKTKHRSLNVEYRERRKTER